MKKLKDHAIPMSKKLVLECTFSGNPKMFVTWFKDGKQVYASYRYNTKVKNNTCILECLHSCNQETTGVYSCEVSNAYGTEICHAHVVAVPGLYAASMNIVGYPLCQKDLITEDTPW